MKNKFLFVGVIGALVVFIGVLVFSKTRDYSPELIRRIDPRCDSLVEELAKDIEAGLGVDISAHRIFWEKESNKPWPIASLTKLMVVLIAMGKVESGELELADTIEVTAEASRIGGAQVYLKEGERFPLRELLEAMIVYSANDAAYLVGQYIGGSKERFVKQMNERVLELGLRDTRFWNMTGLPPSRPVPCRDGSGDELHNVSTCRDMAVLAIEVIKFPEVREWARIKVDSFRGGKFQLLSWNTLMRNCNLVDGLKTGYYREAGWNIVATSLSGERKVMVIILGAKSRWARDQIAKRLIEYAVNWTP